MKHLQLICEWTVTVVLLLLWGFNAPARAEEADWIDLHHLDPSIRLDLRYASSNNFLKRAVYPAAVCWLRRPVADRLMMAQRSLLAQGYSLKLWDCYRPLSVQKQLWQILPDSRYVADPQLGSRHNRGAAVDVTLVTAAGEAILMPTDFDDFSPDAAPSAEASWSAAARTHFHILLIAMQQAGFTVLPSEWWHFDSVDWQNYPISDQPIQ